MCVEVRTSSGREVTTKAVVLSSYLVISDPIGPAAKRDVGGRCERMWFSAQVTVWCPIRALGPPRACGTPQ